MPDELLDVVGDDDVVTARETRSVVHLLGFQHRGVHVFLVTPEGGLLVQQRGRHKDTFPLAFDCSVSEHVKAGENYREAANRGLEEELDIRSTHIQPLVKFKMNYGPNDNEICQLYEGRLDPALVRFDPLEVEGISYQRLEELEKLMRSGNVLFCDWFVQLLSWYMGRPSEMKVLKTYSSNRLLYPPGNKRR